MENFIYFNPVTLHFGRNCTDKLGDIVRLHGSKVMLVYGKGSIKANGIYDNVIEQLNGINAEIVEFGGIKSNPVVEDVDAAAEVARKYGSDVIVAVGGGSVIDSAKILSITIPHNGQAWDFYSGKAKPQKAVPLIAVLTLAATGTEMNPFAVLQNHETMQKLGYGSDLMYPKNSFLDPAFTISVPENYTAYGIADLTAHCLEAFFGEGDASLSDKFVYAIIREAVEFGPQLMADLNSYDLRARIMYAAMAALNRTTFNGRVSGDWGVHAVGHVLSLLYDIPHGASLSVVYPAWMKYHLPKAGKRISELGKGVFGISEPEAVIRAFSDFFRSVGSPVSLDEVGIGQDKKEEIVETLILNRSGGVHFRLSDADYPLLVDLMFNI